jgi:hypothetical protein
VVADDVVDGVDRHRPVGQRCAARGVAQLALLVGGQRVGSALPLPGFTRAAAGASSWVTQAAEAVLGRGLHNVALVSSDVEQTVRFCQDLLEFR